MRRRFVIFVLPNAVLALNLVCNFYTSDIWFNAISCNANRREKKLSYVKFEDILMTRTLTTRFRARERVLHQDHVCTHAKETSCIRIHLCAMHLHLPTAQELI